MAYLYKSGQGTARGQEERRGGHQEDASLNVTYVVSFIWRMNRNAVPISAISRRRPLLAIRARAFQVALNRELSELVVVFVVNPVVQSSAGCEINHGILVVGY